VAVEEAPWYEGRVQSENPSPPRLRVLGANVPETIPSDLRACAELAEPARANLPEILIPCLEPQLAEDTDRRIEQFCRKHDTVGNRVALAIRGIRFVIWEAARVGASADDLMSDLRLVVPDAVDALAPVIVPAYEASRPRIRRDLLQRTLSAHGAIVTGVEWSLHRVLASQHAARVDADIGVITLSYREGAKAERLTLQFDRDALLRLRSACDRLLG